mmetsp:Transcript_1430/g.2984  ORF Transcript_1430/g.2984 Transcript_1430/m.2984 type:complete len:106 (-) Transcript_1430:13-330(-)
MAPLQQGHTMQSAPRDLANDITMSVKLPQQCNPMAMSNDFETLCGENEFVGGSIVDPGGKNKSSFIDDMEGMEKSSILDGEKEYCRVCTFFRPASFALRSTSFRG